nr:unnamed protein product [Callosobruchus analis]
MTVAEESGEDVDKGQGVATARQDTVSDLDWKDSSEACSSSHIHPEIEESQAHTLDVHLEIEEPQVNDSDISADCNIISSDGGNFGDNLTECERKIVF